METSADKTERQARIWPWVLIAIVLLLLAVVAILASLSPNKPWIQVGYIGPEVQLNEEFFWATNASSRTVMFQVKCIETNSLGRWCSSSYKQRPFFRIPPHEQIRFGSERPLGADAWRPRFTAYTEGKGLEIYWWYAKWCGKQLLHGGSPPRFPKSDAHVFDTTSQEVIGPVVSPKP